MRRPVPGKYIEVGIAAERFKAFVSAPLPPEPPIVWSPALRRRFDEALLSLGRLDALTAHLPNGALLGTGEIRRVELHSYDARRRGAISRARGR